MKFKRLSLHGFKSFVDKTALDFPDGITAIVGPNGSGKSNIMDAVRWVFGEQSAKELRGADMDDVVFNGSAKRKPAGFAEVSLTLSDIDDSIASKYGTFSDITITRKFYRSGEREYYINNRKCRLKDIKEIFMDTGLGARSISIIEQGKVDKIINSSPEELRFFLEETAGVTKFKDKKKDAEKNLANTRENLDRINDIVTGVFERMEQLSSQVEKLKLSEDMQNRKRALEKQFLSVTYSNKISEEINLLKGIDDKKLGLASAIKLHNESINNIARVNSHYSATEEENKTIQENRLFATTSKVKADAEIQSLKDKIHNVADVKSNISLDIEQEENKLNNFMVDKARLQKEIDDIASSKEGIDDKVAIIEEVISDVKLSKRTIDEDVSAVDVKFNSIRSRLVEKREDKVRKDSDLSNYKSNLDRLENEKATLYSNIDILITSVDTLEKDIETTSSKLKNVEVSLSDKREAFNKLKSEVDFYRIKQSELSGELKNIKLNIDFLEQEILSFTLGSGDDSKPLKSYQSKLLIDELENLSSNTTFDLSDIILFEDSDFNAIINTVKALKFSMRFTFRSELESIKKLIASNEYKTVDDNIYYVNNTYKKIGEDDKGGKIIKIKEKMLKDTEQMAIINEELVESSNVLNEMLSALTIMESEITLLDEELRLERDFYTKYVTEIESIRVDLIGRRERVVLIDKELDSSIKTVSSVEDDVIVLTDIIATLEDDISEVEEERTSLLDKQQFIIRDLENRREEHNLIKREQSIVDERVNSITRELTTIESLLTESSNKIKNLKGRLLSLTDVDEISWKDELEQLLETVKQLEINVLTTEEDLKKSQDTLNNLKIEMENLRRETGERNRVVRDRELEITQSEIALASTKTYIETISQQYLEKFGADINDEYREYLAGDFDSTKTRSEISKLEADIEKLGPLNLNAVNDYNETDEKYKFLTTQRDDLESSISDINIFINETDQTTSLIFEKTFASVRDNFTYVFKTLFGNGESELRLTDPDNILTSGIEIYVQPPGKKLQHMGLLSGGEKALVAMTLLFALFLQKPTPFCFLDEVDAPLDDANVERYTDVVKTLSDKTQFILITHNHNTMAVADSLYGVKMQESGVSSILSVKLDHSENI